MSPVVQGRTITGLLLVLALIHFAPITGFFGTERLAALYELEVAEPNLEILMRHRAMLFGMLGAFLAYAAFTPALQPIAFVAAFVSLASFFFLVLSVGEFNPAIRRVALVDVVASACLVGAVVLYFSKSES